MKLLDWFNLILGIIFFFCYFYQIAYIPLVWILRRRRGAVPRPAPQRKTYAFLICARNESAVIADLLDSIAAQTYPGSLLTAFVLADNCTDDTAAVARAHGAIVWERQDLSHVGKGFALRALLRHIRQEYPGGFDGYFVFDADNVLRNDYVERMNEAFCAPGACEIFTSYRNSKNYGDNWISAGYALWFLRESRYLNHARSLLRTGCAVSGTGFLFSRRIAEEMGDWNYFTLTEDIEFSVDSAIRGHRIGFCPEAEFFDEQPTRFSQSWRQRLRWSRGYLQVFARHSKGLIRGIFRGSFTCFDMTMSIMPAMILSALSIVFNLFFGIRNAVIGEDVMIVIRSVLNLLVNTSGLLTVVGAITTVTEWKHIHTSAARKILFIFTFPLFMLTYIPISIASLFCDCGWKPIEHKVRMSDHGNGI